MTCIKVGKAIYAINRSNCQQVVNKSTILQQESMLKVVEMLSVVKQVTLLLMEEILQSNITKVAMSMVVVQHRLRKTSLHHLDHLDSMLVSG